MGSGPTAPSTLDLRMGPNLEPNCFALLNFFFKVDFFKTNRAMRSIQFHKFVFISLQFFVPR